MDGHAPHERALAPSPFPGDDGAPRRGRPRRPGPLRRRRTSPPTTCGRVAALCGDRLLVPVVADGHPGGEHDRRTRLRQGGRDGGGMLQRADGGKAMLGFTGLDALQAWDARARPVPVTVDRWPRRPPPRERSPSWSTWPDHIRWCWRATCWTPWPGAIGSSTSVTASAGPCRPPISTARGIAGSPPDVPSLFAARTLGDDVTSSRLRVVS